MIRTSSHGEMSSLLTFDIEPPSYAAVQVLPFIRNVSDLHIKRLKSIEKEVPYRYLDLFFMNFDDEQNLACIEAAASKASKGNEICGCYKLLQSNIHLNTTGEERSQRLEEQTRKYYSRHSGKLAQTEMRRRCRGYIFLAYKTMDDMSTEKLEKHWKSWSGVRLICDLMKPLTIRRLALYKHCFREAEFRYVMLIQTEHLLLSPETFLNVINYVRERVRAHIALYREIDFSLGDDHTGILNNSQIFVTKHNLPLQQVFLDYPIGIQKKRMTERRDNQSINDSPKHSQPQEVHEIRMFSANNDEMEDTLQISILQSVPDSGCQRRELELQQNTSSAEVPSPAPRYWKSMSTTSFNDRFFGTQNKTIDLSEAIQVSSDGSVEHQRNTGGANMGNMI